MTKLTEGNLKKFIKARIESYKNEDDVVSRYNDEQQTVGDYNGRQILELIQNADDAGAENISFKLDPDNNELIFFNDGIAFDLEGMKSIMIAHYSSKLTSSYIGNKGLGFRSVLNWAERISIYSAGLRIDFSRDVLGEYLQDDLKCLDLDDIRKKRKLSTECIPIPILGLPRVTTCWYEGCNDTNGCALKINYKKGKKEDIINLIKAIDERTLLFLQHIKHVTIQGFPESDLNKSITIHKEDWNIYSKDGVLGEKYQDKNKSEKKKYSVKIAIPKSGLLNDATSLYNYLPSQEQVHLPFLLHATVELDSTRNHVNKSDVNDFILQKAAELICDVAQKQLDKTNNCSDWIAYRMMTPMLQDKYYGRLAPLYNTLDELKQNLAIYPTIDNHYTTANNYYYYNDGISNYWRNFDIKDETFLKMLQPKGAEVSICRRELRDYSDAITNVSKQLKGDVEKAVCLIRHLYNCISDYRGYYFEEHNKKISVLFDSNNNIIEDVAFILDSGDKDLTKDLPEWVKFDVIHDSLSRELVNEFEKEISDFKQNKQENQHETSTVRCLVGLLKDKDFVDVRYFDKTYITEVVVRQANAKLKEDLTDKQKLIGEMLECIYRMKSDAELLNVNLLNEDREVTSANELLLPTKLNKQIFEGIDTLYALSLDDWQEYGFLSELDEDQYEVFMQKLGANRLLGEEKFKTLFENGYYTYLGLREVYSSSLGQRFKELLNGSADISISVIRDFIVEKLQRINLHNVLLFISSYNTVFEKLTEPLKLFFYYNKKWKDKITQFNYIQYQLSSLPCVKWKVFGCDLILDNTVDIDGLKQNEQKVDKAVELIRTDFRFEKMDDIRVFLNSCPTRLPKAKNIRKLYKLIIDGLADRDEGLENVLLYASDVDGHKDYHQSTEVFYSDNTCMPKKVIRDLNLFRLDYPSRQGVDKITKIFGLKSFDDLKFEIKSITNSSFSKEFDSFFRELKPYFLLYAIQNTNKPDSKTSIASYIKNCSIHLVSQCEYSIMDGVSMELDNREFINAGNDYYLNVREISSIAEMKTPSLCNAIAEILGIAFKLETKNEHFIHVFQNFDFTKRYIDENRKDEIEECFKLLGISPEERLFMEKYGELKHLSVDFNDPHFYSKILDVNELYIKKVDFSNWNNENSICFLKKTLATLETDEQRKELLGNINISEWHRTCFKKIKIEYNAAFVHNLWTILNNQVKNKQSEFFTLQDEYSNLELDVDWKHQLKEDAEYLTILNHKVKELFNQNGIDSNAVCLSGNIVEMHSNLYPQLIHSIQEEKDMEEKRWWLYFEGNEECIHEYMDSLTKNRDDEEGKNMTEKMKVEGEFVTAVVVPKPYHKNRKDGTREKSRTHKTRNDKDNARLGEEAEKKVDYFLRQKEQEGICKYGEWVSKRNDSAGYDFTYIVDGQHRYLEVKATSDNTFILSANEYDFAKQNMNIYDIAIVKGNQVTIYKSFFKGNPNLDTKDYYVSFGVQNAGNSNSH